mmetsp:Transcript_1491/g.3108  ORF Transcript_1491/g.3108 Transcript_1491/m.3108 type:complete len:996 (-) Transcript_1491:76-3063(-)
MPNIKRRFADDDPSDGDEVDSEEEEEDYRPMRGGGKGLRMPGGKGMGKQLRYAPPGNDDDDSDGDDDDSDASDDSDDDDDEDVAPIRPVQRGGGKQLRPSGGKQLRPPSQDDDSDDDELEDDDDDDDDSDAEDDDDSDDDEPPAPIRPVQRGGGKALSRMRPPSDDDDDDDGEEEEPAPQVPVHRGGGKQLRPPPSSGKQLRRPVEESDDDDSDDDDDEEPAPQVPVHRGGGKQLRPPPGGKQLRPSSGGGKQLRRPVDSDDDDEDEKPVQPQRIVQRGGGKQFGGKQLSSGKQLRRVQESEDDDDDDDMMDVAAPDDDEEEEEKKVEEKPEEKDDDGMDDMELDSDDDDDDDEPEPEKKKPAPRGRAAAKKATPEPDDMDESDYSSSEEEFDMDMENLDQNQLIKDEEDRKHLESLSEFDREAILAQRFEQRKKEHDMKVALRETKRKERELKKGQKATKRKAPASAKKASKKSKDGDTSKDEELAASLTSRRSSTRDRDANKKKESTKKALAALREERKKVVVKESESESDFDDDDDEDSDDDYEEKELKPWQKKAQEEKKKQKSQLDEYEVEDDEGDLKEETRNQTPKVFKPAELEDYLLVTLSRARLGKWCNEPYFEKAVKKCFVKLFVGENEEGKRCYRLCRIVSVESSKQPYTLPKAKNAPRKEKPAVTDKMLNLDFAGTRKVFPLRLVSDNKVNQSDVAQYETAMKTARKADDVLGKVEAMKLRRKRDDLVNNFTYSTEDIERKVKEIKKKKGVNTTNLGLEQTRAANAVHVAQGALEDAKARMLEARDGAEAEDAQKEIRLADEALRERLEEEQVILKKVKSRQERNKNRSNNWVDVNERAKKLNRLADVGLNKPKVKESDKSPSGKVAFNPYARRKVKPKNLWQVGQGDDKPEAEESKDAEAPPSTSEHTNGDKNLDSTPPLVQEQQGKAAALSQSHQFSIDEETLAQTSFLSGIGGFASKKKQKKRVRRGLSLAEYQERKAAGTL